MVGASQALEITSVVVYGILVVQHSKASVMLVSSTERFNFIVCDTFSGSTILLPDFCLSFCVFGVTCKFLVAVMHKTPLSAMQMLHIGNTDYF